MVLVVSLDDFIHNLLHFRPACRGLNQTRLGNFLEVELHECAFQLAAADLLVVILVVLPELVVHSFDVVQFLGNALEFVEINNFVLASGSDALLLESRLKVGKRITREDLGQSSVCATGGDSTTAVLVNFLENASQPASHRRAQVVRVGTLRHSGVALSVAVDPPVSAFLADVGVASVNHSSVLELELVRGAGVAVGKTVVVLAHLVRSAEFLQALALGEFARFVPDLFHSAGSMEHIVFPDVFVSI